VVHLVSSRVFSTLLPASNFWLVEQPEDTLFTAQLAAVFLYERSGHVVHLAAVVVLSFVYLMA